VIIVAPVTVVSVVSVVTVVESSLELLQFSSVTCCLLLLLIIQNLNHFCSYRDRTVDNLASFLDSKHLTFAMLLKD